MLGKNLIPAAQLKAATHEHRSLGIWVLLGHHGWREEQ